jgi:hypothetical protein
MDAEANNPARALIHDDQDPVGQQRCRLAPEQIHTPEAVFNVAQKSQPGGTIGVLTRPIVMGENPADHIFVDLDVERQGDLLCDSRTAPAGVALLHFEDCMKEFCARPFRAGVVTEYSARSENTGVPIIREIMLATTMSSLFVALFALIVSSFRTRAALQVEILALRHQLAVFQKNSPRRLCLHPCDRLLWVVLYRFWSGWRRCLQMVQPDTVVRCHRRAFAWHWTRKSRRLLGRPEVAANIRDLIRRISQANPLWGAPRIHGELLKLGIAVAQSTVARYLPRPRKPPSQTWRTFLTNHLAQTAAIDFFIVPTATFRVLFVFVVLAHERRRVVHFGDGTSHAGVDQAADAGSVSLGPSTAICAARSRCHLRKRLRRHDPKYGNAGSAYCAAIPLAKSVCGSTRGLHPTRVSEPRYRVE